MKVLILKPQEICYGIVDALAQNFGDALAQKGIEIVYFDLKKEPPENIVNYVNDKYMAVIDIYSCLLSVTIQQTGTYLWNHVDAPIFRLCLDFPMYLMDVMDAKLNRAYALCFDRHYLDVIREGMPNIRDAYFFPMAGMEGNQDIAWRERKYDIVFVGSYSDYREWLIKLEQCEEGVKKIAYAYFCTLRAHVELDQKQAFEKTLEDMNIRLSVEEFYQWLALVDGMGLCAAAYQRERMIETVLQAGFRLEVFGSSWKQSPFEQYPNLAIHEAVNEAEYIEILEHAKISLNIMYCNKAGYSERYSYSMLNGAVCVSDTSEYLCEQFTDGKDIVFYDLDRLHELPDKLTWLLGHPREAEKISAAAYRKAKQEHTWEERAERFLEIVQACGRQG